MPLKSLWEVARKELGIFFASPMAYLFLAGFAIIELFVFFWGEAFFARNIADARPLFEWMPLVLIFLSAALTMRSWSEERRTGTIEHVQTLPASLSQFVLGKFLASWLLLVLALMLTLPIPVMVSLAGNLDWGPVWAGYLATLLLGAMYLAIGLSVSARSDNAIVSLLLTVAVCGVFYLVGHPVITNLVGTSAGEILRQIGSGSRFEDITRGIIDVRDLVYYLSLCAGFLIYNVYSLERLRWDRQQRRPHHKHWYTAAGLLIANLLALNIWLHGVGNLRFDATEGNIYSISPVTQKTLQRLQEPLLIRGYFSEKTHPLLAPLVPQMKDLLNEYAQASGQSVRVQIIDPADNPKLEKQANQQYQIKPVPFRVADRHSTSVMSSYFDVLVKYGNEHETLSFRDLIEVSTTNATGVEVQLKNPEYELTRSIRKVTRSYQAGGNLFAQLDEPVTFKGFISAEQKLPASIDKLKQTLTAVLGELEKRGADRFEWQLIEPEASGRLQALQSDYGFTALSAGLLSPEKFYFHMVLESGGQRVPIALPESVDKKALKSRLEAGLKRFSSGYAKTVGLVTPEAPRRRMMRGAAGKSYSQLQARLRETFNVQSVKLSDGRISADVDLLMVLAPQRLSDKAVFALDQYLMRGGRVIVASSSQKVRMSRQTLSASASSSGLEEWLKAHNIALSDKLVMDTRSGAFPLPVVREVQGLRFQQVQMVDYPYFVDLRGQRLNADHPATASLNALTLPWTSAVQKAGEPSAGKAITRTTLATSSPQSWLGGTQQVMPDLSGAGAAFRPGEPQKSYPLAVALEGRFDSFYADKPSPLAEQQTDKKAGNKKSGQTDDGKSPALSDYTTVVKQSPPSARLVVIGSEDFVADNTLRLTNASGNSTGGGLALMSNLAEWALDDAGLMSIRSRGHFNRTLPPLEPTTQQWYEYGTYGAVAALLLVIIIVQKQQRRQRVRRLTQWV